MRRRALLILAAAAWGCEPHAVSVDGPVLRITEGAGQTVQVEACIETNRSGPRSIPVDLVAELSAQRLDDAPEEVVLGVELLNDSYYDPIEATGFVRVAETAELDFPFDFRSGDFCVPWDLRFRILEGPAQAELEVEWSVHATVFEDTRAEISVSIGP